MAAVTQDAIKVTTDLCSQPPLWAFEVLGVLSCSVNLPGCHPFPYGMGKVPLLQVTCCEAGRVFRVARAPVPGEHRSPSIGCADGHVDGQADTGCCRCVFNICLGDPHFSLENLVSQGCYWRWGTANRNCSKGLSCSLKPLPLWSPLPLT